MTRMSMESKITVTNGRFSKEIEHSELPQAIEEGFDHPFVRGCTLVGNDRWMFEIPLKEIESIQEAGLREVLEQQRRDWLQQQASRATATADSAPGTSASCVRADDSPVTDSGDAIRDDVSVSADGLIAQLNQSEESAAAERRELEEEIAKAKGWRYATAMTRLWWIDNRSSITKQLRGSGISAAVHISLLLLLASFFIEPEAQPKTIFLSSMSPSMPEVEEIVLDPTPLEITEPEDSEESEEVAPVENTQPQAFDAPDFMGAVRGDAIKPPAKPSADSGKGEAKSLKQSSFFGNKVTAVNYVYVIDNSNSMTGGRFETALNELMISVSQLTPRQRFYVIFYSDMAYPMFHPQPARQLLPATPRNKEMLRRWLGTVQLCLKTNGKDAIQAAFQLQPDVIFVLGDGAFTDGASRLFAANPQSKIPLHTLGMEVKTKDAVTFKKLAEANGGTYKDVGVSPQARAFAKANPRPRNTSRGPIWGLKLNPK